MASYLMRSKCFKLTAMLAVLLGLLGVTASSNFGEEEPRGDLNYEAEYPAYVDQFEESRSAESGEENNLRYHGLHYRKNKHPSHVNHGRYRNYHNHVRPQLYRTCIDAPQCKPCKAPKVPTYQPPARSVRVESRTWEHQFDENQFSRGEYELRYYMRHQHHTKPSLPQCNKECKVDIPEVPVKRPYFHPASQYQPPGYGR